MHVARRGAVNNALVGYNTEDPCVDGPSQVRPLSVDPQVTRPSVHVHLEVLLVDFNNGRIDLASDISKVEWVIRVYDRIVALKDNFSNDM